MIDLDWVVVHHHQTYSGIQRYARDCGNWQCWTDPHAELLLTEGNESKRPDGIIGRATERLAELSKKHAIPVVNFWRNSPALGQLPSVLYDVHEGGRMGASHLLARGFRNFGFLGFTREKGAIEQLAGFREATEEAGYPVNKCILDRQYAKTPANWMRFRSQLTEWIETLPRPVGILASHDLLARFLVDICGQLDLKVPHDVAVVGSTNELVVCTHASPALSSIDFGFERVGFEAAALLDRLMDGEEPPSGPIIVAPRTLEARQSSDAFVVNDSQVSQAMRFIAEHAHESIDVADVAMHVAATPRTLTRLFQRELGQTIFDAITHLRIERVKRALMEPGAMLKGVAAECGFRDADHLYSVFSRVEGVSPSDYREHRGWKKG